MDLAALRKRLDGIDQRLVDALAERLSIVTSVASDKLKRDLPLRHVLREEDILTRIAELSRDAGIDTFFVTEIFQRILDHSVRIQQELLTDVSAPERAEDQALKVGFQGSEGAYSHLAAQRHFGPRNVPATFVGFNTFRGVLEALQRKEIDRAVLPIENTTAGSINDVYDLLAEMDFSLVGEEVQRVDHCLIGLDETVGASDVGRVYSHPQALAQCTEFLSSLRGPDGNGAHVESFTDTAMAVRKVKADGDRTQGAIASSEAARLHGLHIVRQGIANQRENFTRMVVAAREPVRYDLRIPCKTSVVFAVRHEEGALLHIMQRFAQHHLSLTKLESRPRPRAPWEYLFYADFEGNVADPQVAAALDDLPSLTSFLKVLGSYPARNTSQAKAARPRPVSASTPPAGSESTEQPQPTPQVASARSHALTSRARRSQDSVVRFAEVEVGGEKPTVVVATVPTLPTTQLRALARRAKTSGVNLFLWEPEPMAVSDDAKPPRRSSVPPLVPMRATDDAHASVEEEGVTVVVPVTQADRLVLQAKTAQALWLSGRLMDDRAALEAAGTVDRAVFLERAAMASLDEWLGAAEVILSQGNQQVVLVEAGVRAFAGATQRSLDLAAIAQLVEQSHLPVLVDPSQCTDSTVALERLSRAALTVGASGVVLRASRFPTDGVGLCTLAHELSV